MLKQKKSMTKLLINKTRKRLINIVVTVSSDKERPSTSKTSISEKPAADDLKIVLIRMTFQ